MSLWLCVDLCQQARLSHVLKVVENPLLDWLQGVGSSRHELIGYIYALAHGSLYYMASFCTWKPRTEISSGFNEVPCVFSFFPLCYWVTGFHLWIDSGAQRQAYSQTLTKYTRSYTEHPCIHFPLGFILDHLPGFFLPSYQLSLIFICLFFYILISNASYFSGRQ